MDQRRLPQHQHVLRRATQPTPKRATRLVPLRADHCASCMATQLDTRQPCCTPRGLASAPAAASAPSCTLAPHTALQRLGTGGDSGGAGAHAAARPVL